MLIKELHQCNQLSIPYLVLHPGAAGAGSVETCIRTISECIDSALNEAHGKTMLLLENTAGQGSAVGFSLQQLKDIYTHVHTKKRLGICFDTCHAFAAGYDFTTPASYTAFWKEFDTTLGIDLLKAFHMNDSKKGLGSRVDRHEQIGKGKIGIEAFRLIVNDHRFEHIPKILETPYDNYAKDALNLYKQNLDLLRSLIGQKS